MPQDLKPWFPLTTERLLLREFREDDFEDVHAYARRPEVCRYMDWGPNTREDTQAFMDRKWAEQAQWPRDAVNLAIERRADRRVIGSIRLEVSDPANQAGDFGYTLHPDAWRQGYATEAAAAVIAVGFRDLGLHRIWAECDVENLGSWGVMQKLGMRREAHLRDGRLIRGDWRDRYVYAVLASERISPG
jgi:ribosomal-protein-alanine N-acetyltransferase